MKLLKASIYTAILLASTSSISAEYVGTIGFTTDYVDRGVSQTDEDATLQFAFDVDTDNFYAGLFTSDVAEGDELQLYGGYQTDRNGINYRAGITQYIYTDHDFSDNITELNLSAGTDWKGADVSLNFDYANDVGDDWSGNRIRFYGFDVEYSRTSEGLWDLEFHGNLGHTAYESKEDSDYITFWQLGVSKELFSNFVVSVDYYDTDNSEYTASERAVLSASYQF